MEANKLVKEIDDIIFDVLPHSHEEEVSFGTFVNALGERPLSISAMEIFRLGLRHLAKEGLQRNRRKGYVRSIRQGFWKREEAATLSEVAHSESTRTRRGARTIINVAREIDEKKADMPDLDLQVDDDMRAWIDLGREFLG